MATFRSIYDYHKVKLWGSECLFSFKGDWSLLIKRLSIKVALKSLSLLFLAYMEKWQKQMNDCKINDVTLWQYCYPILLFSNKSKNSDVFGHFDFKMTLSFAIIGCITATAPKFRSTVKQKTEILHWTVKKSINLPLVWNTIWILQ